MIFSRLENPCNLYVINTDCDAERVLNDLQDLTQDFKVKSSLSSTVLRKPTTSFN